MIDHSLRFIRLMREPVSFSGVTPPAPDCAIQLSDDAYHYEKFAGGTADLWYIEWWYFNLVAGDRSIIALLEVLNPGDHLKAGRCGVTIGVFPGSGGQPSVHQTFLPLTQFTASASRPDVVVGQAGRLQVADDGSFHLQAASQDGAVKLDLVYRPTSEPAFLTRGSSGPLAWERAGWLAWLPEAVVNGTMVVDGLSIPVRDGAGYHDHDWGRWLLPARTFIWAAFSAPASGRHFDMGWSEGFLPRYEAVYRHGDLRVVFPGDRIQLPEPSDWVSAEDLWHLFRYPGRVETDMTDASGRYRLHVSWSVREVVRMTDSPIVLFEQRSLISGVLYQDGSIIDEFSEEGFSEWTSTWLGEEPVH